MFEKCLIFPRQRIFCGGRGRRWLVGASLKIGKMRRKGVPLTVQVITRGSWLFYLTRKYRNYPKSFFLLLVQRRVHGQSVLRLRRTDAFKKKKKKKKNEFNSMKMFISRKMKLWTNLFWGIVTSYWGGSSVNYNNPAAPVCPYTPTHPGRVWYTHTHNITNM